METKKDISYLSKNFSEFRTNLIDFAKQLLNESQVGYESFWAFNINNDDEVALMFDLMDINNPIEITDEAIQKTTWDSVKPPEQPF